MVLVAYWISLIGGGGLFVIGSIYIFIEPNSGVLLLQCAAAESLSIGFFSWCCYHECMDIRARVVDKLVEKARRITGGDVQKAELWAICRQEFVVNHVINALEYNGEVFRVFIRDDSIVISFLPSSLWRASLPYIIVGTAIRERRLKKVVARHNASVDIVVGTAKRPKG